MTRKDFFFYKTSVQISSNQYKKTRIHATPEREKMDNLESAVTAALDPTLSDLIKSQATSYCEQVRESADGWQLCLGLFVKFPQTYFFDAKG